MAKSLTVAFLLWGTLGLFGAHHFYLGRDRQGVIQLVTLGGFLVGWMYDSFQIRNYVKWANRGDEVEREHVESTESNDEHSIPFDVDLAGTIVAHALWRLIRSAISEDFIPADLESYIMPFLMTFVFAYAVYFVGNIGESEGSFWSAAKGAFLTVPYYILEPEGSSFWCSVASASTFGTAKKVRSEPEDHGSALRRFGRNAFLVGFVLAIATSSFIHNCTLTVDECEPEVRCIDAMEQFKEMFIDVYIQVRYHGVRRLQEEINRTLDFTPEEHAARILGLSGNASEFEIRAAYKKLARQHHPDKVKDPEQRLLAQRKFMGIAAAYRLLSTRAKRVEMNPDETETDCGRHKTSDFIDAIEMS